MPGTTPTGFPYALPADPLVQWPATSQALAEKIDAGARVLAGTGKCQLDAAAAGTIHLGTEGLAPGRTTAVYVAVNRTFQGWASANGYGLLIAYAQASPNQQEIGVTVMATTGPTPANLNVDLDWIAVRI